MKHLFNACVVFSLLVGSSAYAQQLPNANFDDWSGPKFDDSEQPASWNYSNVTQFGYKFNFAHKATGRSGSCMLIQDQDLKVAGIGETSPGYVSLGHPWVYIEGLTKVSEATAGTYGGIDWAYRPDTMAVWIKRTGGNTASEDFHLLYYAWTGQAQGNKYKGKNGNCTSVSHTDEESDIRQALDGNECGTSVMAHQVCEGWYRTRANINEWTLVKVPIYYMDNTVPEKMNVIFSASNYPNFRANSGLYAGNSLYVDDVELIYSSAIQQLYVGGSEWRAFDPTSTEEQIYVLDRKVTQLPEIKAIRGAGQLTNARGNKATFYGRELDSKEMTIVPGVIDETPTLITVKAEDGSSQTTYKILFAHQASSNAYLSGITVNGQPIDFSPYITSYTIDVPYGDTTMPIIEAIPQEAKQTVTFTQPTSMDDVTVITVTAADRVTTQTYTLRYQRALLSDNTLKDILINGNSLPDFLPTKTVYSRVSIPLGTTMMPQVEAVSPYPQGAQTIVHTPPSQIDGGTYQIAVTTPGNQTPKIYKLTFKLEPSSYCKLKGIYLDGVLLSGFAPDNTTYMVSLPKGTTALPTITCQPGDAAQQIDITPGGLDGTTRITVTAGNGDKMVYKINFTTAKSTISTLQDILLDGVSIAGFDSSVTSYTVQLPIGTTTLPTISVVQGDPYEKVTIVSGGVNGTTRITVSAGNGSQTVYQITFSVCQASDVTLTDITVGGQSLPGFRSDSLDYTYVLPRGTETLPVVGYTAHDAYQKITIRSGGVNGDYKITVRAQTGATQVYTIHFYVPQSANTALSMIYLDGVPMANFDSTVLNYTDTLDISAYPTVTCSPADPYQKITIFSEDEVTTIRVMAENGAVRIYTIVFVVRKSESAYLKMIYLNGDSLPGFEPSQLNYPNIYLAGHISPAITVDKEEGQQVIIMAPYGAGTASVQVSVEAGGQNTYLLYFVDTLSVPVQPVEPDPEYVESDDVTLHAILLDQVPLATYQPSTYAYSVPLPAGSVLPEVVFVPNVDKQSLIVGQINGNTFKAFVTAENGDTASYMVQFQVAKYDNANLKNIQLADYDLPFVPTQFMYTVTIDEGKALPTVSYEPNPGQQVLYVQTSDTQQQLIVTAESGRTNTYIINYTRVVSSNALLKDILLNGVSLQGFVSDSFNYVDTLAWRTRAIPSVHAVGAVEGQTITTYCSAPKHTTTIHVVAQDGVTEAEYTIAFPTQLSSNAELADMYLETDYAVDMVFDPAQTEYMITVPFEADMSPRIVWEKGEAEQTITYISRSLGQPNEIIVQAEDGTTLTYQVTFIRSAGPQENLLKSIYVVEAGMALDMSNKNQRAFDVVLPYGAQSMTVTYTKSFSEQTVLVQPGGLYSPTILTVSSNAVEQVPTVYTIRPVLTTQNPAALVDIVIDGVSLNDFEMNRLTYIVNRKDVSTTPQVTVVYDQSSVQCVVAQDLWHWTATVTAGAYTNTYTIYWHYTDYDIPNGEFTSWTKTLKTSSLKPTGWNATNDYVGDYDAGQYVQKASESVVLLNNKAHSSLDWAWSNYKCAPAMINLASMSASQAVGGKSRGAASGTVPFYNTPDEVTLNYRLSTLDADKLGALFRFTFTDNTGQTHTIEHKQKATQSSFETKTVSLGLAGKTINGYDVLVDAASAALNGGKGAQDAKLYVDYIRFKYNNLLAQAWVNGHQALIQGNDILDTLANAEQSILPDLAFVGQVPDQSQWVQWQDASISGDYEVREAVLTNYGEDGKSTAYNLSVWRPLETNTALATIQVAGMPISGFDAETLSYTYTIPAGKRSFPDVVPVPASNRQVVTTALTDSVVTIMVTPEKGAARVYTIRLVAEVLHDATLKNIVAEGITFDPNQTEYTIVADELPTISLVKRYDAQQVTMAEGQITVVAEDGTTMQYHITLQHPDKVTSGQLAELEIDGNIVSDFMPDKYEYEHAKPQWTAFTRVDDADSVIYTQKPDTLTWQVMGSEQHTYTLTFPSSLSSSTELQGIYLNGDLIEGFSPSVHNYVVYAQESQMQVVGANDKQSIAVQQQDSLYTITVTAEDGTVGTPYTLVVLPYRSSDATLRSITLNGVLLSGFSPQEYQYAVELPTGAYKEHEPMIPTIGYQPTDSLARVEVITGALNEKTYLLVTSSDGSQTAEYEILFTAEPSHNVELSAIIVNDVAVEHFDATRHFYSVLTHSDAISIDWRKQDKFSKVTVSQSGAQYQLHVVAQDGVTTTDYVVEVYSQVLSSDATLAMILLDGKEMSAFQPGLSFSPGLNQYTISIPTNATLPEIVATLKMDGQSISIRQDAVTIYIDVTAPDGVTMNTYTLQFVGRYSDNTALKLITLDGDTLPGFRTDSRFYFIDLPEGMNQVPELYFMKAEKTQKIDTVSTAISDGKRIDVLVTAESGVQESYILIFRLHPSTVNTLSMLYADGDSLDGFQANVFNYHYDLPVGTTDYPTITWESLDEYPVVTEDTLQHTATHWVCQYTVTAESGHQNRYIVSYTILQSEVDTLQMIFLNGDSLAEFQSRVNEYTYILPVGTSELPSVYYTAGDAYQTITLREHKVSQQYALGIDSICVKAQNGNMRVYVLRFQVAKSSDTTLNMIYYNGIEVPHYDEQVMEYSIPMRQGDTYMPLITYVRKEVTQQVEVVIVDSLHVQLYVTAEDQQHEGIYTLSFIPYRSSNAFLDSIWLDDAPLVGFSPMQNDYDVTVDSVQQIPTVTYQKAEKAQQVTVSQQPIYNDSQQVMTMEYTLQVWAEDSTLNVYTIAVHIKANTPIRPEDSDNARLTFIKVDGQMISTKIGFDADFDPEITDYHIVYPVGYDPDQFISVEQITCAAQDSLALIKPFLLQTTRSVKDSADQLVVVGTCIRITVIAPNQRSITYSLYQDLQLDSLNRVIKMIVSDNEGIERELDAFDANTFYYEYTANTAPSFRLEYENTDSRFARYEYVRGYVVSADNDINYANVEGEQDSTFHLIYRAENGTAYTYKIKFRKSGIDIAQKPMYGDVLLQVIPGSTQIAVATLRANVVFTLYDQSGRLVHYRRLPMGDPNNFNITTDGFGQTYFAHVTDYSRCTIISLDPHKIYFWAFLENGKRNIQSGKIAIIP